MNNGDKLEELIIAQLDKLEAKLDQVRTDDLPKMRTEMALLINENKASSKLHSAIGGAVAMIASVFLAHFDRR